MLGSTIISESNLKKLQRLGEDHEALDEFEHVNLDSLCTLDFEKAVAESGLRWMLGQAVFHDEENGVALAKISPEGLAFLLNGRHEFDEEQAADLKTLRAFVGTHGSEYVYELATF